MRQETNPLQELSENFLTDKPKKIIDIIKRREAQVVSEHAEERRLKKVFREIIVKRKAWNNAELRPVFDMEGRDEAELKALLLADDWDGEAWQKFGKNAEGIRFQFFMPPLEEALEQVVVKQWPHLVSVYPVFATDFQRFNEGWPKFSPRSSNTLQAFGFLLAMRNKRDIDLELWRKGDMVTDWEADLGVLSADKNQNTLRNLDPPGLITAWQTDDPAFGGEPVPIDFPLFLPDDWAEQWTVTQKTQLVTFCK